jgi:hypothetical protein
MENQMKATKPSNKHPILPRPRKINFGASPATGFFLTMAFMVLAMFTASATLTPYSWQRFETYKNPGNDFTGLGHHISGGFTGNGEAPSGSMQIDENIAVGGPLGPEGYFSQYSLRSRASQFNNQGCSFQEPSPVSGTGYAGATKVNTNQWGNLFQTNLNWAVECWLLPSGRGAGANVGPVFATGVNRNNRNTGLRQGVVLECLNGIGFTNGVGTALNDGHVYLRVHAICEPGITNSVDGQTMDFYIGPPVLIKTPTNAAWIHAAVVRDDVAQTVSWYTNGNLVGSVPAYKVVQTNEYATVGFAGLQDSGYTGTGGGLGIPNGAVQYEGYIAELRWSHFAPGQFSVTNLLTRRTAPGSSTVYSGPTIVKGPQNVTVWAAAAGSFACVAATDTSNTYQWQRGGVNILNATNRIYVLENTSVGADNGAQFRCVVTANSQSGTSAVATLTVQANSPAFITGYSNAVMAESSLLAYFPVDGSTGTVLNNTKDPSRNGVITNAPFVYRTGNTNRAAGNQALAINSPNLEYTGGYGLMTNTHGYVEIPGDHPGFDFATASAGNGTVEAVLYLEPSAKNTLNTGAAAESLCWFSSGTTYNASGGNTRPAFDYFTFGANAQGALIYQNSVGSELLWTVPGGTVGKRLHVAFVFSNTTNVTCYVNGQNLGTKLQVSFGNIPPSASQPLTIGKRGGANADFQGYFRDVWRGTVDDLAIYGSALSAAQIQEHFYRLNNGSGNTPASIVKITPSKNLYTGFPVQKLNVTAGGSPPYTYQWRANNVNILNATNSSYDFVGTSVTAGVYPFSVVVQGAFGSAITSAPVVLTVVNPTGYGAKVYASSGGGPKAFYPLDETSGTAVLDWAGTHDGELSGAYLLGNAGPAVGTGSIRMFGTNLISGGIETLSQAEVPFYPELNPENGGNFTHEFWYKPTDANRTICAVSSQALIGNAKAGLATMHGIGTAGIAQTTIRYWTMIYGKYNNLNQGVAQNVGTSGVTPAVNNQWQHIASVADGNSATVIIYVNGVPDYIQNVGYSQHPGDGSTTGGVNQNYYAPLILGNRNLGGYAMDGYLSQVAIYDYALSSSDVTSHTEQIYTPAVITLQPVGTTAMESVTGTVTLIGAATGLPNTYQWQKDGVDLVQTANLDGSDHYPRLFNVAQELQGVNSPKLVISQTRTNDTGLYTLKVLNPGNPGGFTNSTAASVIITNDFSVPTVTFASALGTTVSGPVIDEATASGGNLTYTAGKLVEVRFSKRMDSASVVNPANYSISGGVTVSSAVQANNVADLKFGGDYKAVTLATSGLTPGASYTLTVSDVLDQASFPNEVAPSTINFVAPTLNANAAVWTYYYRISGGFPSLASGTNGIFPLVPQAEAGLTNFSSDAVSYGQNLNNNVPYRPQVDNYASTISAWVTPTNTGYYEFFINGDDQARLYFNPSGADPAGATWIGDSFENDTSFNDIFAIPTHYLLSAGQPYYIQAVHAESGGNDHVRVGWRYLGTVDQAYDGSGANGAWIVDAASLGPIEGKFLSAYVKGAAPAFTSATSSGGSLTLSWTGAGILLQSTNVALPMSQWSVVPGNPNSPFVVVPGAEPQKFYRLLQSQ